MNFSLLKSKNCDFKGTIYKCLLINLILKSFYLFLMFMNNLETDYGRFFVFRLVDSLIYYTVMQNRARTSEHVIMVASLYSDLW